MPTLQQILLVDSKKNSLDYELFLYSFPEDSFFDKVAEMEKTWGVPVGEIVRDELFCMGLNEERGEYRLGPKMRKKIMQYLNDHPMPLQDIPIKNLGMKKRQQEGKLKLLQIGRDMYFDILCDDPGVMMWSRDLGILAVAGTSWCYIYKTCHSFRTDVNFPIIGYFQLAGRNISGQLAKAIMGSMQPQADALSERRRAFMVRKKKSLGRISSKRNGN